MALRTLTSGDIGAGIDVGIYTPAGGTARPATHAAIRRDERPIGNVQRLHAHVTLFQFEINDEPTDGATVLVDGVTWTIRTARRAFGTWRCEAWA